MSSFSPKFETFDTYSLEVAQKFGLGVPVRHCLADIPQDQVIVKFAQDCLEVQTPREFESEERWWFYQIRTWQPTCSYLSKFKARHGDVRGEHVLWLDDLPRGDGISFSGTPEHNNILMADPLFVDSGGYREDREYAAKHQIPWRERRNAVFWRGSSSGYNLGSHWSDLPRFQMCELARRSPHADKLDIGIAYIVQIDEAQHEEINNSGFMKPQLPTASHLEYRYAVDIDGNANSWPGLFVKMVFGNTILKIASPHGYTQWFYEKLIPWTHFVPVESDMTDFDEKIAWCFAHPEESERIAANVKEFADALTVESTFEDLYRRLA